MYNKIYQCLNELSGMLNVKEPDSDYLDVLAGLLEQKIKTDDYLSTVIASLISTYSKNSFPKYADFQNIINQNTDITRNRHQQWVYEYADKIGVNPDKIANMKWEDYTPYQRQQLDLMSNERQIWWRTWYEILMTKGILLNGKEILDSLEALPS